MCFVYQRIRYNGLKGIICLCYDVAGSIGYELVLFTPFASGTGDWEGMGVKTYE